MSRSREDAGTAYRGPDRRGEDRSPPPLGLEDPRGHFWRRATAVAPITVAFAIVAAGVPANGLADVPAVSAGLHLLWVIVCLAAATGLYLRWRLTGEAPLALLAAAMVAMSLPRLPLSLVDAAADPHSLLRPLDPMSRLVLLVPTAWLLWRCVRAPAVDSAVRPVRLSVVFGGVALAVAVALSVGRLYGLPPLPPAGATVIDVAVTTLAFVWAWAFRRQAMSITRPASTRIALVFAGLGVGSLLAVVAHWWWQPLVILAGVVVLTSLVLLGLLAVSLLRSVVEFNSLRMMSLNLRAYSAEESVRRDQEQMHELRATVAGLSKASETLRRHHRRLDPSRKHDLQQMVSTELERLERLLSADRPKEPTGPVPLDDIIRPLVVGLRERGTNVGWRPTGTFAVARPDEITEVLNILLTNAHMHAPGAGVELAVDHHDSVVRVTVSDDGPGVAPEIAEHIFDRGTRSDQSTGHGLGLHIARRLAAESGGTLVLVNRPYSTGAKFALTLQAGDRYASCRPSAHQLR